MKCNHAVKVLLATAVLASATHDCSAATINGVINLQFDSGPLATNNYVGSFSYDDGPLTGSGTEMGLPDLGNDPPAIDIDLTLAIVVEGLSLTESDDEDYPDAPLLTLQDCVPISLDYFTLTGGPQDLELDSSNVATFVDNSAGNSVGTYTLSIVPEPSTATFLGIGMLLFACRGRRRSRLEIRTEVRQ